LDSRASVGITVCQLCAGTVHSKTPTQPFFGIGANIQRWERRWTIQGTGLWISSELWTTVREDLYKFPRSCLSLISAVSSPETFLTSYLQSFGLEPAFALPGLLSLVAWAVLAWCEPNNSTLHSLTTAISSDSSIFGSRSAIGPFPRTNRQRGCRSGSSDPNASWARPAGCTSKLHSKEAQRVEPGNFRASSSTTVGYAQVSFLQHDQYISAIAGSCDDCKRWESAHPPE